MKNRWALWIAAILLWSTLGVLFALPSLSSGNVAKNFEPRDFGRNSPGDQDARSATCENLFRYSIGLNPTRLRK
jgi:hypothetical protein